MTIWFIFLACLAGMLAGVSLAYRSKSTLLFGLGALVMTVGGLGLGYSLVMLLFRWVDALVR